MSAVRSRTRCFVSFSLLFIFLLPFSHLFFFVVVVVLWATALLSVFVDLDAVLLPFQPCSYPRPQLLYARKVTILRSRSVRSLGNSFFFLVCVCSRISIVIIIKPFFPFTALFLSSPAHVRCVSGIHESSRSFSGTQFITVIAVIVIIIVALYTRHCPVLSLYQKTLCFFFSPELDIPQG